MSEPNVVTAGLLAEITEAFNTRDVEKIASYFAEDATFATARGPDPWGYAVTGRETIRDYLAQRFAAIPDMRWEQDSEYVAGDRGVSVWTVRGTSRSGEVLNYRGCDLYTFAGGKIIYKDTYWKVVDPNDRGGLPGSD